MPIRNHKRRSKRNREFFQTLLFFSTTILSIAGLIAYLWVYTEIDENIGAMGGQAIDGLGLSNDGHEDDEEHVHKT